MVARLEDEVSKTFLENPLIQRLLDKTNSAKLSEVPLVVSEERYTKTSAKKKLGLTVAQLRLLINEGLIIGDDNNLDYLRARISNPRFVRTLSLLYGLPEDKVRISEEYLQSRKFKRRIPESRVKILCNAYLGAKWFEIFCGRLRSLPTPVIKANQVITIADLPRILGTGEYEPGDPRGNLRRLIKKGFIIPEKREFIPKSARNTVHNRALAKLVNIVTGAEFNEVYNEDDGFESIVQNYIDNLIDYMEKRGIDPSQNLTIKQAENLLKKSAQRLKRPENQFYKAIKKGEIRRKNENGALTKIDSIDLMMFALKPRGYTFDKSSVLSFFGYNQDNYKLFDLISQEANDVYDRSRVGPFYQRVTRRAREKIDMNPSRLLNGKPTLTYEQIVRQSNLIQGELDIRALKRG